MGMDPNLTVLVYENGMGVHIHKLFAQKHRIAPGSDAHPSIFLKHEAEIPHSERVKMESWIHPDDLKYMEERDLIRHPDTGRIQSAVDP